MSTEVAPVGAARPVVRSGPEAGGRRPVIVVLGMHRSGTSLLANVLHLLGADMLDGAPLTSPRNPTGFWERPEFVALHDEILAHLKRPVGALSHVLPFPAGWWRDPELQPFKRRLQDLVAAQLAATPRIWGFKDPRTCRLLPLWAEVFDALELEPRFVWTLRHPAESGTSMKLKNPRARPMSDAQGELMWLSYNYDVLRYAGRHRPVVVKYDEWFADPLAVAGRLAASLDLRWEGGEDELRACLEALVDPQHRHHWAEQSAQRATLPIAAQFHRYLEGALAGPSDAQVSGIKAIDLLLGSIAPFAQALDEAAAAKSEHARLGAEAAELRKETEALRAQLAAAQAALEADRGKLRDLQGHVGVLNQKLAATRDGLAAAEARREAAERDAAEVREGSAAAATPSEAAAPTSRRKPGWFSRRP